MLLAQPREARAVAYFTANKGISGMMTGWMDMTGSGIGHWVFFILMVALTLYPIGRILGRLGFSPFWSVLALIPLVNLIGLWLLAFIDWPKGTANRLGN
jgi:hypothetical protein